jgi:iron complex outermembrane receptor protein
MKSIFLFFLCLASSSFFSQGVEITLLDSKSKDPIANAQVFVIETDQSFKSSEFGKLTIPNSILDLYQVKISANGYRSFLQKIPKEFPIVLYLEPIHLDLQEVTISSGSSVSQNKNPFHIETRKISDLNQIPAINLGELIGRIPGVYQSSLGNGISKPVVRGMQGMRVITMVNGLRLEGQQWGGDHGMGLSELGIGSVEVIKGPASLIYGADALGGVIYLMDVPYAAVNTSDIQLQTNLNQNTLGGVSRILIKKSYTNWRWLVGGSYSNHADFQIPDGRFAKNSRFNAFSLKGSISFKGKKSLHQWRMIMDHSVSGIPGHTHDSLATPETFQILTQARKYLLPSQFFRNYLAHQTSTWYLKNLDAQLMIGYTSNQLVEYDEKVTIPSLSMNLQNSLLNSKFTVKKWKDLKWISGTQAMFQTNRNAPNATDTLIPNSNSIDFGVYSTLTWSKEFWVFQSGLRYDMRSIFDIDKNLYGDLGFNFNGINGSIGAVFSKNQMIFRSNISTGYRAPHLTELLSNGFHHGALRYEIGDKNLISEKAIQLDVTLELNQEHSAITFNPFVNLIQNYIYIQPIDSMVQGMPVFIYEQAPRVLFLGGDVAYHFHPHFAHKLHWEISASYIAPFTGQDSSVSLLPQPRLQNMLKYEFGFGKKIKLKDIHIQSMLFGPQNQVAFNEQVSKAYHLLDFGALISIGKQEQFTMNIGVRNLFNTRYIDHLSRLKNIGMPSPGRGLFLSLNYQIINKPKKQINEN